MERRPSVRKAWGSYAHVDQPLDHPATEFSSAMALKELVAMEATAHRSGRQTLRCQRCTIASR
jgi:hypothetical protein